jgi:threonylcarbamoyladenosine tRNA methylthiotransferase MtaB
VDLVVMDKNKILNEIFKYFPDKIGESYIQKENCQVKTRANIKVQTGCNNFCTYCIVPYLRGKPVSIPIQDVINSINKKTQKGFKEVILSGINIGKYQSNKHGLVGLIKFILRNTNIPRLRLSSINPEDINNELIELFKDNRLCNHLHLSLQSGSNTVLKRMGRKYSTQQYKRIVTNVRQIDQYFGITTDVIVGFPGENDKEFNESLIFIADIEFLKIHIFKYSKRNGTAAAKMSSQISPDIKKRRVDILKKMTDTSRADFLNKNISRIYPILFELKNSKGEYFGYSPNYIRIKKSSKSKLTNSIKEVKIKKENIIY